MLLQAFDAGDPNLTVAYLKSTIEQDNFYRVEVRDKASGASLFGPVTARSLRCIETCSTADLGSRFGAELVACRRVVGAPELIACGLFVLTIALVAALGIRFIRQELSDWSDGLSATLDRLSTLGSKNFGEAESLDIRGESPIRELSDLRRRIVQILADSRRLIEFEAVAKIAAQVAHDIKSPLAALEGVTCEMTGVTDDGRILMASALARIRGIADDLHRKEGRAKGAELTEPAASVHDVDARALLREILAEKRAQYRSMDGVRIGCTDSAELCLVRADAKELARIVSNLVNNAVEALPNSQGLVNLEMLSGGGVVEIRVIDDGRGVPAEILPLLAREGATFGKPGGSGLGLFHARKTIEAWGGRLEIKQAPSKGTIVSLFIPALDAGSREGSVLIDDDPLVRANWNMAARRAGIPLHAYEDQAGFLRDLDAGKVSKSSEIFIDCELGSGAKGEDVALELHRRGCININLATGHRPESFRPMVHVRRIVGKSPPW